MSLRARIGTALVLISFTLSVVFALVPAQFNSATLTWRPQSQTDSGSLQLTRGAPERMSIETTCDLARDRTDAEPSMLSTGSLELSAIDDVVYVQTTPEGPAATVALPPGECIVRATYTLDPSVLRLTAGDVSDQVAVAPPAILNLHTTDPPAVSRVDITTQETGLAASWGRWSIGLLALAALLAGSVLLWLPASRPRHDPRGWRTRVAGLAPVDGFVTVGLVGLALVMPPLVDDGWIIERSGVLQHRWWFGDLYGAHDAWLPLGVVHELVLSALQAAGLNLAHIRILVALLVALTWIVLRRGVLAPAVGEAASRWPPAAATYVAFSGAWLITVRQEPAVLFFAVLALTVAISHRRSTRPGWVFLGLLAAGLALATHQTGWVAAAPALMILWSIGGALHRDSSQWLALMTALVAAVAGLVLVVFAAADIHTLGEGARTFGDGWHSAGPFDELARYTRLFTDPGARVFTVLLLLVWCLAGSLGINTADPRSKKLWILCMLWLAGLLVTSSKWQWHFAVYAIPAVGLATLAGVELRRRDRITVLGTSAVLVTIGLAVGVSMTATGTWNMRDLGNHSWPELTDLLMGGASRIYWYLALVLLLVLGLVADARRGRWQPAALAALCLSILLPIGASVAWLVADAAEPGWSPTGANLRQLSGSSNACGVLDGLDIDADPVVLATQQRDSPNEQLLLEAFPRIEGLSSGPLGGGVPAWGTWPPDLHPSPDVLTGLFQSPSSQVEGGQEITLWSAFGSAELLSAEVVFTSSLGTVETTPIIPDPAAHWARLRLTVPEGATEVHVDAEDQHTGWGGWLAVSTPVLTSKNPISAVMSGSTGYANPLEATLASCLNLPDLSNGYWDRVHYVSSEGWAFDTTTLRRLTVTDVACRPGVMCLRQIDYPMANVLVTPTP